MFFYNFISLSNRFKKTKGTVMIKQDYVIRMIQEILSVLVNVILKKKKLRRLEWEEYDNLTTRILGCSTEQMLEMSAEMMIERYANDADKFDKMELAAMYFIKVADDMKDDNLVFRAKLQQEALFLLKYIQEKGGTFSLSRLQIIQLLSTR